MSKPKVLVLVIALSFFITGCWDVLDVTNRAFVTTIGLDASKEGYRVTVAYPRPALIRTRSASVFNKLETVEATSITEAINLLQSKISRDITLSQLRIMLVGEKLARKSNFNDLMSFLGKNPEVALRFRLMFVDGNAEDVLRVIPKLDRSKTSEFVGLAQAGEDLGNSRTKRFLGFLGDLRLTDGYALGTRVIVQNKDREQEVARIGGAIFRNWRLVGWLNGAEMEKANLILRQNPNIVMTCKVGKGQYSYLLESKRVKISPNIKNNKVSFKIKIKVTASITEQHCTSLDITKPKNLKTVQHAIEKDLLQKARQAVNRSQKEIGVDYLGFNRALLQNDPELYKRLAWDKVYPGVPVKLDVDVDIPRVGIERR